VVDLIYSDIRGDVLEQFPHAKIKDASDEIHGSRILVELPSEDRDAYGRWLVHSGWALQSLMIVLMIHDKEGSDKVRGWLNESKHRWGEGTH